MGGRDPPRNGIRHRDGALVYVPGHNTGAEVALLPLTGLCCSLDGPFLQPLGLYQSATGERVVRDQLLGVFSGGGIEGDQAPDLSVNGPPW